MTLLDANVLVALVEPTDPLHDRATRDLTRAIRGRTPALLSINLAEAAFFLDQPWQRRRLRELLDELRIEPYPLTDDVALWSETFDWLAKYAEHSPDFADAVLAVLAGRDARIRVWTYDREFATIWRRPDGAHIPLAVRISG